MKSRLSSMIWRKEKDKRELSCLFLFILTHGEESGTLHAHDVGYLLDRDIIGRLTAKECPKLAGKPKVIFLQACAGVKTDKGVKVRSRHTSADGAVSKGYKIPNFVDFLVFQASYHGHYAFRSKGDGSWLVQSFCKHLQISESTDTLTDVMTDASKHVAIYNESNITEIPDLDQNKQTPVVQSTLIRRLYLKKDIQWGLIYQNMYIIPIYGIKVVWTK